MVLRLDGLTHATIDIYSAIITQRIKLAANLISQNPVYKALLNGGFIQERGVVQSLFCDQCNMPHDADIVFEDGRYGYYCPDLGFVQKDRSELIAVLPSFENFTAHLADLLECKRRKNTPIAGAIWRVGVVSSSNSDLVVYFCPTLRDARDLEVFRAALGHEVKLSYGITLTALDVLELPPYKTVKLNDALSFDALSGTFILDLDLFELAGVPASQTGGRPSPYAKDLKALIEHGKKRSLHSTGAMKRPRLFLPRSKNAFLTNHHHLYRL